MSESRWKRLTARLHPAAHDRIPLLAPASPTDPLAQVAPPSSATELAFTLERRRMVEDQLRAHGRNIHNPLVLEAMARVPRHAFVPSACRAEAYADHPLPIGFEQTISQPYIVAFMTEAIDPRPGDRVLEIGTGSGYQTAVLARIVAEVHTLEIVPPLARAAAATFRELGIGNITVHEADGSLGWPASAPFDAVVVTCAPRVVPACLVEQLRDGGRLIVPVGDLSEGQELVLIQRAGERSVSRRLIPVRFVPMTGDSAQHPGRD